MVIKKFYATLLIYNKLYIKELLEKGYRPAPPAPEFEVAVSSYVNS